MLNEGNARKSFTIQSAQDLAAQRIAPMRNVVDENAIDDSACKVEDGWKYCSRDGSTATVVRYEGHEVRVVIPESLGGLPVSELYNQVFARNSHIESVDMPDSITHIGMKVFFQCAQLKSVRLSNSLTSLDSAIFAGCKALAEVHLPSALEEIGPRLLFDCPLANIVLPRGIVAIAQDALNPKTLKHVEVEQGNAVFSSDGVALFEAGGKRLVRLMCVAERYRLPEGCSEIADNAFKGMADLAAVELNDGLERIGSYAFFRTGLSELTLPHTVVSIGNNAFALCARLKTINLNEGLVSIEDQAFAKTGLSKVRIPSTVERIGRHVFDRCAIDYERGAYEIADTNATLFSDGKALYQRGKDGSVLLGLLYDMPSYDVLAGTVEIADGACERELKLERIGLPDGLKRIGDRAFKSCSKLASADLPESLTEIGEEAFWQTKLACVRIGKHVELIAPYAFQVAGTSRRHEDRTLTSMEVSPDNERYYFEENLLIERREGGDRAFLFVEPRELVCIPRSVVEIDEMAFYHAHTTELAFHAGVRRIGPRAFMGIDEVERVHVEFPRPVDGFSKVTIEFPYQARDMEDFSRSLCIDSDGLFFDFKTYDSMVVHELDPVNVFRMILSRFEQPVKLGEAARVYFESAILGFMADVLACYVRNGDTASLKRLADHGYLDGDNRKLAISIAESEKAEDVLRFLKL